jgi:hypothetical protein
MYLFLFYVSITYPWHRSLRAVDHGGRHATCGHVRVQTVPRCAAFWRLGDCCRGNWNGVNKVWKLVHQWVVKIWYLHYSQAAMNGLKTLRGTLYNYVSNDLLSFLWSDKVMIVLHWWVSRMWCYFSIVSRPFKGCAWGTDRRHSEANWVSSIMFLCPWVSEKLKSAEILDCCHSKAVLKSPCRYLMTLSGQKGR